MSSASPLATNTAVSLSALVAQNFNALQVLLVEDSTDYAQLVCNTLASAQPIRFNVDCVSRLDSALSPGIRRDHPAELREPGNHARRAHG